MLRIAQKLSKSLPEVLGLPPQPMTYREMRLWRGFFKEEMNVPDRNDYYVMQLTRTVSGMFGTAPGYDKLTIPFGDKARRVPTPEEASAWSRQRLGLNK